MKSISVIIPTLNNAAALQRCLESLRRQNYDQDLIDVIVVDGHSRDDTVQVANHYQSVVIQESTGSPEAAKAIGLAKAKNELILQIEADNLLPDPDWLTKMVLVLEREPKASAAYPWRYTWKKDDPPLSRYFSLLGVNDPVAWFLGKADRQSYLSDNWILAGQAKDKGDYFLVEFDEENLPTLGAKGFLIRREILLKARVGVDSFFHMDVNVDLVRLGFNCYAVVKNSIVHTDDEGFVSFFQRRKRYMEKFYLRNFRQRRYFVYHPGRDRGKIVAYSFYSLTILGPVLDAARGYLRIPDPAWFFHPFVCFLMFWLYSWSVLKNFSRLGFKTNQSIERGKNHSTPS